MGHGQEFKGPCWLGNRILNKRVGAFKLQKVRTELALISAVPNPGCGLEFYLPSIFDWMNYIPHKFEESLPWEAIRDLLEPQSPSKYSLQTLLKVLVKISLT